MVTTRKKGQIQARRKTVAANLLSGLTLAQIADGLGVSATTIARDAESLMKQWKGDQIALSGQLVELQNARLDRALNAIWSDVLKGSLFAIDRFLKIEERRAKLLGLDKPTRVDTMDLSNIPDAMLDRYEESGDPTEIREFLARS